jgi:hypothetical protein
LKILLILVFLVLIPANTSKSKVPSKGIVAKGIESD